MSREKPGFRRKKSGSRHDVPEIGLGRHLWNFMEAKGWDLPALIEETGLPRTTVWEIIYKKRKPGFDLLQELVLKTDINPNYLFTGEGPMLCEPETNSTDKSMSPAKPPWTIDNLDDEHLLERVRTTLKSQNRRQAMALRAVIENCLKMMDAEKTE
jgi:hypothetical protein